MESRWYIPPGKTLETTKISDREHALHVTSSAWKGLVSHLDRNRLTAETLEKERAHKHALKEGSDAMTRNWPDSKEVSANSTVTIFFSSSYVISFISVPT